MLTVDESVAESRQTLAAPHSVFTGTVGAPLAIIARRAWDGELPSCSSGPSRGPSLPIHMAYMRGVGSHIKRPG